MNQINIKDYFKQQVNELRQSEVKPSLTIVDGTNNDAGNQIYIRKKVEDFQALNWPVEVFKIPQNWNALDLNEYIKTISSDCAIVQLPVRDNLKNFDINSLLPIKDCDGLTKNSLVLPATVRGIIDYLDDCGFQYEGKNAVVIGRSEIVGKPMAKALLDRNMTISVCHSKTDINQRLYLTRTSDLVVSATGNFTLTRESCPYAIVVDVGIRRNQAGTILGDFLEIEEIAKRNGVWSTPVPGGVGLLTRLGLMKNCLDLKNISLGKDLNIPCEKDKQCNLDCLISGCKL